MMDDKDALIAALEAELLKHTLMWHAERERREAAEAILRNQLDYGYFRENVNAYFARYPHNYDKD